MINIYDIEHGWATLEIGYCSFIVSYLSNLKGEIDYLLDLSESEDISSCRKIVLEGESAGDLVLVSYLTYGKINDKYEYILNIVWQRAYSGKEDFITNMKFSYKDFKKEWKILTDAIKFLYINNFVMPSDIEEYEEELRIYEGR